MPEPTLIPRAVDDVAGDFVQRPAGSALFRRGERFGLRAQDGAIKPLHVGVGSPEDDRARHVGAVAVHRRAEIHGQKSAFKTTVARNAVRTRGSAPRNGDGVKRQPRCAVTAHEKFEFQSHVDLGHLIGANRFDDVRKRRVGDRLGARDGGEFVRVFHHAQTVEDRGRAANEFDARKAIRQPTVARKGEFFFFNQQGFATRGAQGLIEIDDHSAAPHRTGDFHKRPARGGRRFDIAEVGHKIRILARDEDEAVVEVETREIALIEFVGQKRGVRARFGEFCLQGFDMRR